jgi:hypothetical protein
MTTISQPRQLDRTRLAPRADLATTLRHLCAAIASFTAHAPRPTSGAASARDIALRSRQPSPGTSLTTSQRFQLPR